MVRPLEYLLATALAVPCTVSLRVAAPSQSNSSSAVAANATRWAVLTRGDTGLLELEDAVNEDELLFRDQSPPLANRGHIPSWLKRTPRLANRSSEEDIDLNDLAPKVMLGYHTTPVFQDWLFWQSRTSWKMYSALSPAQRSPVRVLLVTYVLNTPEDQSRWQFNTEWLMKNHAQDIFNFAFFHHDGDKSLFEPEQWYQHPSVVLKKVGSGCKPQFWAQLDVELIGAYDYVWLIDGDLSLAFFNWDIYRSVLRKLRPLVSQPSVIPKAPKMRSTDLWELQGKPSFHVGSFEIAREAPRSEVMTPIIDTHLWPAFRERLKGADYATTWYLDVWWDIAAQAHAKWCGGAGIVVVNGSPVRHMDTRTMDATTLMKGLHCTRNGNRRGSNNRAIAAPEKNAMKLELCETAARMLDAKLDDQTGLLDLSKQFKPAFFRYYTRDAMIATPE